MIRRILVPTDFMPKSEYALEVACQIAAKVGAKIDLMHIVEIPFAVKSEIEEKPEEEQGTNKLMDEIVLSAATKLDRMSSHYDNYGVEISTSVRLDRLPDRIAELIVNEEFDLLVLGGSEVSKMDEFIQKTHPEKIVELAGRPVVTINKLNRGFSPKKILLPTNLKDNWEKFLPFMGDLYRIYEPELYLLYVNTPSDFTTSREINELYQQFTKTNSGLPPHQFHIYQDKQIKDGIIHFSEEIQSELVVVVSNRQWNFTRIIKGDITEYLVSNFEVPLITFNIKRAR